MQPRRQSLRLLAFATALVAAVAGAPAFSFAEAPAPRVVASITPIHSLVAAVMEGVGEPVLLVEGAGSPHAYRLRPSEARALSEADLVFRVGGALERFLEKPLAALAGKGRVVTLGETAGLALLPARAGGAWQAHVHEGEHGHDQGVALAGEHPGEADQQPAAHAGPYRAADSPHGQAQGAHDLHVWLDPQNAVRIVRTAVAALREADPANAARYTANGKRASERLERLDRWLAAELAPVRTTPYVVFHDAYHYFEHRYGLNAVGSITVSPDRAPGARRVSEIRERIIGLGARCVFSEPQFEPALGRTVIEGTPARLAELDPLGSRIPAGPEAYFRLMRALADALTSCLAEPNRRPFPRDRPPALRGSPESR